MQGTGYALTSDEVLNTPSPASASSSSTSISAAETEEMRREKRYLAAVARQASLSAGAAANAPQVVPFPAMPNGGGAAGKGKFASNVM